MAGLGGFILGGALQGVGEGMIRQGQADREQRLRELEMARQDRYRAEDRAFRTQERAEDRAAADARDERNFQQQRTLAADADTRATARENSRREWEVNREEIRNAQAKPDTRTIKDGDDEVTEEWDRQSRTWKEVGRTKIRTSGSRYQAMSNPDADGNFTVFDRDTGELSTSNVKMGTKPGGGGGGKSSGGVSQWRYETWLKVHPGDEDGALAYSRNERQMTPAQLRRLATQNITDQDRGAFGIKPADRARRIEEEFDRLMQLNGSGRQAAGDDKSRRGLLSGQPAAEAQPQPQAAEAPPAAQQQAQEQAGPSQPKGSGTQQDPYVATKQAEVDWFKATAPAGAVISINGQLFTK